MLTPIQSFYKRVRLTKKNVVPVDKSIKVPITFVKIFHKEYPRLDSISLHENHAAGELEHIIKARKSIRKFSNAPLSLEEVSLLLNGCKINEKEGYFERRAYPSAGARFPIEIYPVVFNVEGLKPGAYHYNSNNHSLELLIEKDLGKSTSDFVSSFIENPAMALIMTAVIPRSEVKYGLKAYPFSLIEAGHIGQNIYLLSTKYNLGCCAIGGYVDETICKVLDLTKEEIPIYSLAIGKIDGN